MSTKNEKGIKPKVYTKSSEEGEIIQSEIDFDKGTKSLPPSLNINLTSSSGQQEFILGEIKTDLKYMKRRLDKIESTLKEMNKRLEEIESFFALGERAPGVFGKWFKEIGSMRAKKK